MKKILFVLAMAMTVLGTSCKKELALITNTPTLIGVDQYGNATVALPNGSQTQIRAIINPSYTSAGLRLNGECIITAPPIKPANWERDNYGHYVPVGFIYNEPEFTAYRATAWVVECYQSGNVITGARMIKVSGDWGNPPNPASYVNAYSAGSYLPSLGYSKVLSVTKVFSYPYQSFVIN